MWADLHYRCSWRQCCWSDSIHHWRCSTWEASFATRCCHCSAAPPSGRRWFHPRACRQQTLRRPSTLASCPPCWAAAGAESGSGVLRRETAPHRGRGPHPRSGAREEGGEKSGLRDREKTVICSSPKKGCSWKEIHIVDSFLATTPHYFKMNLIGFIGLNSNSFVNVT